MTAAQAEGSAVGQAGRMIAQAERSAAAQSEGSAAVQSEGPAVQMAGAAAAPAGRMTAQAARAAQADLPPPPTESGASVCAAVAHAVPALQGRRASRAVVLVVAAEVAGQYLSPCGELLGNGSRYLSPRRCPTPPWRLLAHARRACAPPTRSAVDELGRRGTVTSAPAPRASPADGANGRRHQRRRRA